MKKFILALILFLIPISAFANPQVGMTPCTATAQPADLTFSGTSANVHLSTCGATLIVFNNSANDARYRLATTSALAVAVSTDLLLPAHTFEILNVGIGGLWFAAIQVSSGGTISFIQGGASN